MLLFSCVKNPQAIDLSSYKLSYGDSVFYLKSKDYTVAPTAARTGSYRATPEDLNMDPATGKINVTLRGKEGKNSQTGLRYRIIYTAPEGKEDTTYIVLAGINYQDRIYSLAQNQTMVNPIYNGDTKLLVPGGVYTASNNKLAINRSTGQIDLKKTIDNGFFNDDPQNSDWRLVTIEYQTNDGSTSDENSIDVVVYYYTSVMNIPSNVSTAMRAHQDLLLGIPEVGIPETDAPVDRDIKNIVSAFKPRPPCIVIIGR
jgi:hypothetical protein